MALAPCRPASSTSLDMRSIALFSELVRQPLDIVGCRPRDRSPCAGPGLLLNEELGVAGNAGGEVRRQGKRLVKRVGVQRLGMAVSCRQRFDAGPGHVVEHVLRGQATSLRSGE